jgi:hypothetical protein
MPDSYQKHNNVATCLKNTPGTVSTLQAVYPVTGDGEAAKVELAKSDDSATMPSIGIAAGDFSDTEEGPVIFSGLIVGVNTSAWDAKDELWVSSELAGVLTKTQPQSVPSAEKVAQVIYSHATDGMLLVYNAGSVTHLKESDGSLHPNATQSAAGFMSATDKTKLDGFDGLNLDGGVPSSGYGGTTAIDGGSP